MTCLLHLRLQCCGLQQILLSFALKQLAAREDSSYLCNILVHVKVIRTQLQSSLYHRNPCNTKRRHSWLESPSSFMNEALSKDQQGRREHGRHLASSSEAMWIDASSLMLFTWNWVMVYQSHSWDNFCSNRSVRIFFPLVFLWYGGSHSFIRVWKTQASAENIQRGTHHLMKP